MTQAQVRRIELAGIQLRPGNQGHGIGTAIIRELHSEAAHNHVPTATELPLAGLRRSPGFCRGGRTAYGLVSRCVYLA
jgi:GNAT superfamily N-acetyltransferase